MTTVSTQERQRAFGVWLRTGRLPPIRNADGLELKFNPYHDPRNGRFTFAPGGARGFGEAGGPHALVRSKVFVSSEVGTDSDPGASATMSAARRSSLTGGQPSEARLAPAPQRPVVGRGSNVRAFEDPMTLEQSFPGLRNAPGGAMVAVADSLFDFYWAGKRNDC